MDHIIYLPFPGGPNSSNPLAGDRKPVKSSGLKDGRTTISCNACFAVWKIVKHISLEPRLICLTRHVWSLRARNNYLQCVYIGSSLFLSIFFMDIILVCGPK